MRSINKRGLGRAGFSEDEQKNIVAGFKRLYRGAGSMTDRLKAVDKDKDLDPNVREMVDAVLRSNEHRFGRHLELYR